MPHPEQAAVRLLRGHGHRLAGNYAAAIAAFREALELDRTISVQSNCIAIGLNAIAYAEQLAGDLLAAERDCREALRVARAVNFTEGVVIYTSNLAGLALDREDWVGAEALARDALPLAEKMGRQQLVADTYSRLAQALVRQGRPAEALPYAQHAVAIFTRLGTPDLEKARATLAECEG